MTSCDGCPVWQQSCPSILKCALKVRHQTKNWGCMEKFSLEFKEVVSEKYLEGKLSLKSVYANRKKELPDDPQISESTWRKERRTSYSREFKIRLVKQALQPGAVVARIAREHNINDNLLFNWKRLKRAYWIMRISRNARPFRWQSLRLLTPSTGDKSFLAKQVWWKPEWHYRKLTTVWAAS